MKTMDSALLHELPLLRGDTTPNGGALTYRDESLPYAELARRILAFSGSLLELGVSRGERVGVYLEKRFETVITCFGATAAGAAFVPINPLLKPEQVGYILGDCNVRVLVTSSQRFAALTQTLAGCTDLRHVIVVDDHTPSAAAASYSLHQWRELSDAPQRLGHRVIDGDMAAILYTSGSTGRPKGVVLSHRNMVIGAKSVASYLENHHEDVLMAALPLSFDAGFSQLTTGFHAGARVVLLNYLLPKDVINTAVRERVTGLTAVPPLYIQLSQLQWPETITDHLRYFANTGGRMPLQTLNRLRTLLPKTKPFLMYGLTEAFRATYLPPEEVERRPDSIGKAIPNAEILVLRDDGSPCVPNEPGELVQRGALVAMGYWGDPEKTAERFKPLPERVVGREAGLVLPEIAVFSGDTVRQDEEGFLYFIGRRDEMIKTSGYRVSPTEIEEALYATQLVGETAAFGVPHPELGHAIVVVVTPPAGRSLTAETLLAACGEHLPVYMMPRKVDVRTGPLPRNANGKIDRKLLSGEFNGLFEARSQER
jgi:acyl-CoA ligase (AMP-forming) (exosortase A-associated)